MAKYPTIQEIEAMPLLQQAMDSEDRRHRARLQEIKQMTATLALLEAERAKIKAAGYTIYADNVSPVFGERATLRIVGSVFDGDFRLCKALLVSGFTIVKRDEGDYQSAHFKKGRLTVRVYLSTKDLERAEQAVAAASTSAPAATASEVAA